MSMRLKRVTFIVLILLLPVFLIGKYTLENNSPTSNNSSTSPRSITLENTSDLANQCQLALKQMDGPAYNNPAALAKLGQSTIAPIVYQVNTDIADELSLSEVNQYITLQNQYLTGQYQAEVNQLPIGCKPDQSPPPKLSLITNFYSGYIYKG
jgi:hypothetical protein